MAIPLLVLATSHSPAKLGLTGFVGLLPLLHAVGALSFPVLLGVGFAVGSLFPAYSSAQRLVLGRDVNQIQVVDVDLSTQAASFANRSQPEAVCAPGAVELAFVTTTARDPR